MKLEHTAIIILTIACLFTTSLSLLKKTEFEILSCQELDKTFDSCFYKNDSISKEALDAVNSIIEIERKRQILEARVYNLNEANKAIRGE